MNAVEEGQWIKNANLWKAFLLLIEMDVFFLDDDEQVNTLIRIGANVNVKHDDEFRSAPLHIATRNGLFIRFLLNI